MIKRAFSLLIALSVLSFAQAMPESLDHLKHKIIRYVQSGQYAWEMHQRVQPAKAYLRQRLRSATPEERKQMMIVFDIDETVLSNFDHMKAMSFGGNMKTFNEQDLQSHAKAIEATRQLYRWALKQGLQAVFITGRHEDARGHTASNLHEEGFKGYKALYLKPKASQQTSAAFKAQIRHQLMEQGYDIVLNVGDQASDFQGGYSDHNLKLPNPFYVVP